MTKAWKTRIRQTFGMLAGASGLIGIALGMDFFMYLGIAFAAGWLVFVVILVNNNIDEMVEGDK